MASEENECCNHNAVENTLEDLNGTCIPVVPVLRSTPAHSPNKLPEPPAANLPENPIKSFADAVSRNIMKPKPKVEKIQLKDVVARLALIEEKLLTPTAETESLVRKPVTGRRPAANRKTETASQYPSVPQRPTSEPANASRERCLIIMNAPESDREPPPERILHDQLFLEQMVSKLFDDGEDGINVISAFRLGKRSVGVDSVPRPLKVVLKSEQEARRVFARVHRLKGEQFRVLRDLCPEDRIRMREAVRELKERRDNGESNLHIVDFQVVVRRPRVVWHPILISPKTPLLSSQC